MTKAIAPAKASSTKKAARAHESTKEDYINFLYPASIWLLDENKQSSLALDNLPSTASYPPVGPNGIAVKWNIEKSSATITFTDIYKESEIDINNCQKEDIYINGEIIDYIRIAIELHTAFSRMFFHHPRQYGLKAHRIPGIWREKNNKDFFQELPLPYVRGDKAFYLRRQIPKQYHDTNYIWVDPTATNQDFGAFYMTLITLGRHRMKGKDSSDPCIDRWEEVEEDLQECGHFEFYWALGQVGVERYSEFALWNDIEGIEGLAEKVKAEEKRKVSLAYTAIASPKVLELSKFNHNKNIAQLKAREVFKGRNSIKSNIVGEIVQIIDNQLQTYYYFTDNTYNKGQYYNSSKQEQFSINRKSIILAKDNLGSNFTNIHIGLELSFNSNLAEAVSEKEDLRRRQEVAQRVSLALIEEGLGDLAIVDNYNRIIITKRIDLIEEYRELFELKEEEIVSTLTAEEASRLNTEEDLSLKRNAKATKRKGIFGK
jgi:hypothetical protein